jgi:hypothetical protein
MNRRIVLLMLVVTALASGTEWLLPEGIKAQRMVPVVIEGKLAGWACIGVSRLSSTLAVKRLPTLEGRPFNDLLDQIGYGPQRTGLLLSWLRNFADRNHIDCLYLKFPVQLSHGDHSTTAEVKTVVLDCAVGRIEVD